jgi:hypothetical protein
MEFCQGYSHILSMSRNKHAENMQTIQGRYGLSSSLARGEREASSCLTPFHLKWNIHNTLGLTELSMLAKIMRKDLLVIPRERCTLLF